MVEESKGPKRRMPEDFVSRFRSKEDLYRYLHSKVRYSMVNESLYSKYILAVDARDQGELHARYSQRDKAVS